MPRKKYDSVETRLAKYKLDYDLSDVNQSNDLESIKQLCSLDLRLEKLHDSLKNVNAIKDANKYKSLSAALRDLTNSSSTLSTNLGIIRKKRREQNETEDAFKYIQELKEQAKTIIDKRLLKLICPCGIILAKYHIFITEKGERGAIEWAGKEIPKIAYRLEVECSRCGKIVKTNQSGLVTVDEDD